MVNIRLSPEYECYPIWLEVNSIYDNISPDTLPISKNLKNLINAWDATFQSTYNKDEPRNSGFVNEANKHEFRLMGERIFQKLKAEIGSNYNIELMV